MTSSSFAALAQTIGQLLQAHKIMDRASECRDELWRTTKRHIKRHLDSAGATPGQFDAELRRLAPRRRLTKLSKMDWSDL